MIIWLERGVKSNPTPVYICMCLTDSGSEYEEKIKVDSKLYNVTNVITNGCGEKLSWVGTGSVSRESKSYLEDVTS